MRNKLKRYYKFIAYALILIIIKQLLVSKLPIYAIANSICDDELMVRLQLSILQFDWLGTFNSLTFVKGVAFPIFLAFNSFVGISYLNSVTLLYSISCLIFLYSIKDIIKNKKVLYIILPILLFNPITYDFSVIQRVYRNSLTPSQVLLIFSYIFYLYTHRKSEKKDLLFWSIFGGINLFLFYNTREDAIWIMPLLIVFTGIILIEYIITNKKKINYKKILVFILPFIILFISNQLVCLINYKYYGVYTRVDEDKSSFSETIKTIYSVPNKKNIKYVSVTKQKLEEIYKYSPTLNSIKDNINEQIDSIEKTDRTPGDGEIEDGWFWWVLRFAAEEGGYYKDAKTADKFYKNVTKEIKTAQKEGKLGKQKTMPSALMSPWRKGYTKELLNTIGKEIIFTNTFSEVGPKNEESPGNYVNITLFEIATNDDAIINNDNHSLNGWYLYYEDNYKIQLTDNDNIYTEINCEKDIKCDINYDLFNIEDPSNLSLKIINSNNEEIEVLKLDSKLDYDNNNQRIYSFSKYTLNNIEKYEKKLKNYYVERVNIFALIYKKLGLIVSILGLLSYLIYTYLTIKNKKNIEKWLLPTSILLTYLVLLLGVGYNEISSCFSITTLYLAGAYPLIIMFNLLSITLLYEYKKL